MKIRTDKPLSDNTRRHYEHTWGVFAREMKTDSPVSEDTVLEFLKKKIAECKLSPARLRGFCAAIDHEHEHNDYEKVCYRSSKIPNAINNYQRGLVKATREAKKKGIAPPAAAIKRTAPAIRPADLSKFINKMMKYGKEKKNWRYYRYAACAILMWTAALRRSEAANLMIDDIDFYPNEERVEVNIASSKGDQYGEGSVIIASSYKSLPYNTCEFLFRWVELRQSREVVDSLPAKMRDNESLFCFRMKKHLRKR